MDFSPLLHIIQITLPFDIECLHTLELCCSTKLFLDAEQLVVLRNTLTSARRTGLDLAGIQSHCQVCDGGILGLTGTVGCNRGVAGLVGHLDCFQSLRYGTDLV